MRVKCVRFKCPGQTHEQWDAGCKIEIGGIYDVVRTLNRYNTDYYELTHDEGTAYLGEMFEPYNPYTDATAEILSKFKPYEGIETDCPVIKELEPQSN